MRGCSAPPPCPARNAAAMSSSIQAMTLTVNEPQVAALYLSGQQVAFERETDGTVIVAAEEACGVLLEFAAES